MKFGVVFVLYLIDVNKDEVRGKNPLNLVT